ncbi:MAG: preprotein translocase subunit YajC [Desulfobulbaceae bacterium]|nr:preprotein translocase subunit YajC [Desulfobulbaceae bacterium]
MINVAYAADAAAGAPPQGGILQLLPLILIFVVFYFLLIRPQQKKAKEQQVFLGALEKGQLVVTSGGIQGKITGLTDKVVTLEVADNVRIKVSRPYIMGPVNTSTEQSGGGAACSIGGG